MKTMKTNRAGSILVTVVLIVILLAAVGGIVVLLRNYDGESIFKTTEDFTITYDGNQLAENSVISLAPTHPLSFQVSNKDYDVKVIPNKSAGDFYFSMDGGKVNLKSVKDYTKAFSIKKEDDMFSITCPTSFDVFASAIWPQKIVTVAQDADLSKDTYFIMQVTSGDKTYSFPLRLMLDGTLSDVTNEIVITLDKTEVCL